MGIKELNEKNPINQRTHQCKLCPKNFCQKEHLRQHIENVHKTYQCEFCAKKFSRREPLCQHLKAAHDGDIPPAFRCEICEICDIWQKESFREAHSNLSPYRASRM